MTTNNPLNIVELDRTLLVDALGAMVGRFIRMAKECGHDDKFIDSCTFFEITLINRIKLRMEAEAANDSKVLTEQEAG